MDTGLLLAVLALLAIGLAFIFSASYAQNGTDKLIKQGIWVGAGLVGMGVLAHVDYRVLSRFWQVFYALAVLALIATLLFAKEINGARSWIELGPLRLQPSELTKFALILAFGMLLSRCGSQLQSWSFFLRSLLFFVVPILLVLKQPDLGTASILCVIWFVMVWLAGVRWWMLASVVVGTVLLFMLAWNVQLPDGRGLIKTYQKQRLDFVHADPRGAGYHQWQSRIAIGAGQLWGKGFRQGTQGRQGFLPEQDTDFIFAVIGEEFGFLGSVAVLGLYLFLLFRLIRIAEEAELLLGRIIVGGIVAMFAAHWIINTGMCLTLSPVTGVPLPFISYGGSNLLTNLLAVGVALNISRFRQSRRDWVMQDVLLR